MTNSLFAEIEQEEARTAAQIAQAESLKSGEPFAMSDWAKDNGWTRPCKRWRGVEWLLSPASFLDLANDPGFETPLDTDEKRHQVCAMAGARESVMYNQPDRCRPENPDLAALLDSAIEWWNAELLRRRDEPKAGQLCRFTAHHELGLCEVEYRPCRHRGDPENWHSEAICFHAEWISPTGYRACHVAAQAIDSYPSLADAALALIEQVLEERRPKQKKPRREAG